MVAQGGQGPWQPRGSGLLVAVAALSVVALVVHGAMLVEPTETESKAAMDQFVGAIRSLAERAKAGDQSLKAAPVYAPRRRLDETLAARKPVLVWKEPGLAQAAE